MVPDAELEPVIRTLLEKDVGFYIGFGDLLEIGQLENGNYWVTCKNVQGQTEYEEDDLRLDDAVDYFLRLRRRFQLGYDIERDLNRENGT